MELEHPQLVADGRLAQLHGVRAISCTQKFAVVQGVQILMRVESPNTRNTPALVALAEKTCWQSVAPALEAGSGTVGTKLELEHTAPTPPPCGHDRDLPQ